MWIDKDVISTATLALLLVACTVDDAGQAEATDSNRIPAPLLLAYLEATETPRGIRIRLKEADFDVGEHALSEKNPIELDRLARVMKSYPAMQLVVEGHTDSQGNQDDNVELSERRARSVKAALQERGIAASRIRVKGLGDSLPIASNETEWGRSRNRRVEVLLIDSESPDSGRLLSAQ